MRGWFKRQGKSIPALVLVAAFTAFLILLGTQVSPSFDASYNLISYQNLLQGKGFMYDYDGRILPFDPAISTGPEFYLPVYLAWKLLGASDYYVSVYVMAAYYAVFLCFLIFFVLREGKARTLSVLVFAGLFLCNRKLFEHLGFIPLGELLVGFFLFAGLCLLCKRHLVWGGLLLGFALDLKTNISVGLLPALTVCLLREFVLPELKARSLQGVVRAGLRVALVLALVLTPFLVHTKLVPALVLSPQQFGELRVAQKERAAFMQARGFGQMRELRKNLSREGFRSFIEKIQEKFRVLQGWFLRPWLSLLLALLLAALLLLSYRAGHFSFYLFIFTAVTGLWWFVGPVDIWYRYFYPAESMLMLGIVALIPLLLKGSRPALATALLSAAVFLPQFSPTVIAGSFDGTEKRAVTALAADLRTIGEQDLFAFGWFQSPQMMLLSNKRFQDYTNAQHLEKARAEKRTIYLVTTNESFILRPELEKILQTTELMKAYGNNRLYRIMY